MLFSIIILLSTSGCATLNESECKTANWEIIGLEDGSSGKPTSYIGQHREACSEYTVSPDLEAYLKGHNTGLTQFCTERNGYRQGMNGSSLNQVCTGTQAREFQRGHQRGIRIYQAGAVVRNLKNSIDSQYHRLDDIEEVKTLKEEELVRNGTSERRRRLLLDEIKELERETESIFIELDSMKSELLRREDDYQRLINN